jgi:two-component sensor histidine kinase
MTDAATDTEVRARDRAARAGVPADRLADWSARLAATAAALGAVVLIGGWGFGIGALQSILPTLAGMAPSTAICLILLGVAIYLLGPGRGGLGVAAGRRVALALLVAVVAAANLVARLGGQASGVDALVLQFRASDRPSTMSIMTSLEAIMGAVCLGLLFTPPAKSALAYVGCATLGLLVALTALTAYIVDPSALADAAVFTGMALHTALGLALVFLALLLHRPDWGWLRIVAGQGEGSVGVRRLLPALALAPVALAAAALVAVRFDYLSINFRLSVAAVVAATLLSGLLLRSGAQQNDVERRLLLALDDLKDAVGARDLLLKEVYHRVKNNLQQMDALIAIEAARVDDPRARSSFDAISGRVRALGTVHEMFLMSGELATFDVRSFLEQLCRRAATGLGADEAGIAVEVEAASDPVTLDFAIPLGLLVNELLTNAVKHGFPDGRPGHILVSYSLDAAEGAILAVEDDGVGLPPGHAGDIGGGLGGGGAGGKIIASLVGQLRARLTIDGQAGFKARVEMPADVKRHTT